MTRHRSGVGPVLATWTTLAFCCALPGAAWAEALPEALAKAYQTNPALNAERARQRATDETVPQALAGYRPQIVASLSAGLQAVRDLLPNNTIQTANLKPWTIGVTVTPMVHGFKFAVWMVLLGSKSRTACRPALRLATICGR